MIVLNRVLAAFAFAAMVLSSIAQAAPAAKPTLSASLIANKDTYVLDPAQAGAAFIEKLDKFKMGKAPPTPTVDLTLRMTNPTSEDISFSFGGDDSRIELNLKGPGAVTIPNRVAMTREFRLGKPRTLAPGATLDFPITSLSFGMRGISQLAYWTETGDYTLTFTLVAPVGRVQTHIVSNPIKIKVIQK